MASEHSKLLCNFALTDHLTEDRRLRLRLRPNFTPLRSAKLLYCEEIRLNNAFAASSGPLVSQPDIPSLVRI